MHDEGEGPLPRFVFQDGSHIIIGIARVNDKRQARLARRFDMGAQTLCLCVARRIVIMIVEPGFADRDCLPMLRQRDDFIGRDAALFTCIVRMRADRTIDRFMALGDGTDHVELAYARANRDHQPDTGRGSARNDRILLFRQPRKIEMAMTVDQHISVAFERIDKAGKYSLRPGQFIAWRQCMRIVNMSKAASLGRNCENIQQLF